MATKIKYEARLLMESGELYESLRKIGCNVETLGDMAFVRSKEGNLKIEVKRNKPYINGVELSQFLKSKSLLEKYLEFNSHIFASEKDDAFDIILNFVEDCKDDILAVGETLYRFNGKYYELFSVKDIDNLSYDLLRKKIIPKAKDTEDGAYFIYMEFLRSARKYNMRNDYSYFNVVKLPFNDGTLYVHRDSAPVFVEGHRREDNNFYCFNFNYKDLPESSGVIEEWFNIRFKSEEDLFVARCCIADLFVTSNYSQAMLYMYGAGGIGKSLLQDTISGFLNERATSTVNINNVGSEFKSAPLFNSIINFSSEISRKQVNAEKFKSLIARDEDTLSIKFKQDCKGRPIAKWFSVANSLPTIEMDSGVKRRLLVIECSSDRVEEVNGIAVSKTEFEQLFKDDRAGFIEFLISGLYALFNHNFDVSGMYESMIGETHIKEVVSYNDPVAYFLERCLKSTQEKRKGIFKDKLFEAFEEVFRHSTMGTGIQPMKFQTFSSRVKELGYKDKQDKVKQTDGTYKNTRRYYEGYAFTSEFVLEMKKKDIDITGYTYLTEGDIFGSAKEE